MDFTGFEKIKEESDPLDNFFFQKVNIQNYKTLSFVVKLVLTLSHGQAFVERQFSVNNQVNNMIDNNMQMMSIVAWKQTINHMKVNQLTPYSIDISKDLLLSVKGASTRYRIYLGKKSKKKADIDAENHKAIISNVIVKLKDQCDVIKRTITMMEKGMRECVFLAESIKRFSISCKRNALKRKFDESKKNLELREEQYSVLTEKKRSYSHLFIYLIKYRISYT